MKIGRLKNVIRGYECLLLILTRLVGRAVTLLYCNGMTSTVMDKLLMIEIINRY